MENEKRLIDANAFKSQITRYHMSLTPRYISKLVDAEIGDVIDIIDETPTVDAVEVVRCKYCKFMEVTPDSLRWCYVWNGINGMGDDGFCNYGERINND